MFHRMPHSTVRICLMQEEGHWRRTVVSFATRSILYTVRHAESDYPPGRFLFFSENLALVLAICKLRSNIFYTAFSHASNLRAWLHGRFFFAPGFRAGFALSFWWIPSELNYSDEGSRFFNSDYDPSKSLLRVLAQRLTRSCLAREKRPKLFFSLTDASGCW